MQFFILSQVEPEVQSCCQ